MEKEFVPYELAFRLKALGFDEPCCKYIYVGDTGNNIDQYLEVEPSKAKNYNADDLCISQPTFSQTFRWFREKLKDSAIEPYSMVTHTSYNRRITFEEAELVCTDKLLRIVEQKQKEDGERVCVL